jgi:hypothetical protein
MIDQWNENIRCSQCRKTGVAIFSQDEHAELPTVTSVPDGFKAVQTGHGPDLLCEVCNVPVEP